MRRVALALAVVAALVGAAKKRRTVAFDPSLPSLGTRLRPLPAGEGRAAVEAACLPCHSTDLLLQQRLTEKQWTATVDKMIRWGATVPDREKGAMIAYLAGHFGPANRFTPTRTRPVGY